MVETTIEDLIISGCDERIALDGLSQTNRYFFNPFEFEGLLHRGSCTASTLDEITLKLLEATDKGAMIADFDAVVEAHADRIKSLLKTEDGTPFEVFFAPSGSDLAYYPILFKEVIKNANEVVNMVTCPEELGSGTRLAAQGLFHAELNQFDKSTPKTEPIAGLPEVELFELRGRNADGRIIDNRAEIIKQIEGLGDKQVVVNLVYGSKSGIEDNLKVLEDLNGENVLCTVDLCQFRNSKYLVQYLLSKNCLIFLTGSKFYQAPPFCGCMLVPESISQEIDRGIVSRAQKYREVFSKYDVPKRFQKLREQLPDRPNLGLHLRWKCALYEMEAFDGIDQSQTSEIIEEWNRVVTSELSRRGVFELMPDMELTNPSIISFKVKTGSEYWNYDELWSLFKRIVTSEYELGKFSKVFIGQPVRYKSGSFLRLAIGARNVISLLNIPENERFQADMDLIELLEKEITRAS